jgi:hypothetical protein
MLMMQETARPTDRRYAVRWQTDKVLWWRLRHGHRTRCSRVIERSLTSLVLFVSIEDAPRIGSILHPTDPLMGDRHGFRAAVVRRIQSVKNGEMVFAEILA